MRLKRLHEVLASLATTQWSTWAAQALVWEATGDDEMRIIAREKQSRCLQANGLWLQNGKDFTDAVQGIKVNHFLRIVTFGDC
jgi:capsid protein